MNEPWQQMLDGTLNLHVRSTKKYKTMTVYAVMDLPLEKDRVTRQALMPALLLHGTKSLRKPHLLMQAVENLFGAHLHARVGKHGDLQTFEYILQVPDENIVGEKGLLETALKLFADVIFAPKREKGGFSPREFEVEKALHQQKIANIINDKMSYAAEKCLQIMAANEPYGIPRLGYAEDLDDIDPALLYKEYIHLTKTRPLHVYLVGDIDVEEAKSVVERAFDGFLTKARTAKRSSFNDASVRTAIGSGTTSAPKVHIEEMDISQCKLNLGLRTRVNYASDDYPALLVYNGILGGFPHSKLFLNVREKASLAYYASSRLEGLKGYMFVYAGIDSDKYEQALATIEEQLTDLRTGKITQDELEFTKVGIINQYRQSEDPALSGAAMQMYARYSGRAWSVDELIAAVDRVTNEDVARIAAGVELDTIYFLRNIGG